MTNYSDMITMEIRRQKNLESLVKESLVRVAEIVQVSDYGALTLAKEALEKVEDELVDLEKKIDESEDPIEISPDEVGDVYEEGTKAEIKEDEYNETDENAPMSIDKRREFVEKVKNIKRIEPSIFEEDEVAEKTKEFVEKVSAYETKNSDIKDLEESVESIKKIVRFNSLRKNIHTTKESVNNIKSNESKEGISIDDFINTKINELNKKN